MTPDEKLAAIIQLGWAVSGLIVLALIYYGC